MWYYETTSFSLSISERVRWNRGNLGFGIWDWIRGREAVKTEDEKLRLRPLI